MFERSPHRELYILVVVVVVVEVQFHLLLLLLLLLLLWLMVILICFRCSLTHTYPHEHGISFRITTKQRKSIFITIGIILAIEFVHSQTLVSLCVFSLFLLPPHLIFGGLNFSFHLMQHVFLLLTNNRLVYLWNCALIYASVGWLAGCGRCRRRCCFCTNQSLHESIDVCMQFK